MSGHKGIENIIKYRSLIGMGLVSLLAVIYTIKAVSVNSTTDPYMKICLLISCLCLCGSGLSYRILLKEEILWERVFLSIAAVFGICIMLMVPVGAAPDEVYHTTVAYSVAGRIMGYQADEGKEYVREIETKTELQEKAIRREYYDTYFPRLKENGVSSKMVKQRYSHNSEVPHMIYLPAALGIVIGRLLGLGLVGTLLLGRFINLLVYLLAGYFAIRLTPVGKNLLVLVMCLPMTLQEASAISSDSPIFSMAFLFIGLSLSYMMGEKDILASKAKLLLYFLLALILSSCKYGACLPIVLFGLLIVMRRREKKTRYIALGVVIAASLLGFLPSIIRVFSSDVLTNQGVVNYSAGYVLTHPYEMMLLLGNSFNWHMDRFYYSIIGTALGWFELYIPYHIGIMMILLLFLSMIRGKKTLSMDETAEADGRFSLIERLFMIFVMLLGLAMAIGGMLVGHTPMGSAAVEGVQGRYVTPYIFPFLMALLPERLGYQDEEDAHRKLGMLFVCVYVLAICCLFLRTR